MKLNLKEWPYMVMVVFFAAIAGAMPVIFAIILSEILQVSAIDHYIKFFIKTSHICLNLLHFS